MRDFKRWINESVLPNVQTAIDTLKDRKDHKDLVRRIQAADPYSDKRFAPIIAGWVLKLDITPEEHSDDVKRFKTLHRRLKDLRVPATNQERTRKVKSLLSRKPHDFAGHYSTLQLWNREASGLLDPDRDLSDEGLPVVMRHDGYTMYKISERKHLQVPIVKNSMSWCVTKDSFNEYGGPPYYPVVRDSDRSPFAMIIPAYFDKEPDEAVRNAQNTGRLSNRDLRLIRPLVQHALPLDKHGHPYINGIHGTKPELPQNPSARQAVDLIKDLAMEPGDWPEGERIISLDPVYAVHYAYRVLKGPFPTAEPTISQDPCEAVQYAIDVLKGRFPAAEPTISQHPMCACDYARYVLKAPWPAAEKAISQDALYACEYAQHVLKGPFHAAEPTIIKDPRYAFEYARDVLKAPWPAAEKAISKDPFYAYQYARYVLKGRFPLGEPAISKYSVQSFEYAKYVLKGPFPAGEKAIRQNKMWSGRYDTLLGTLGKPATP